MNEHVPRSTPAPLWVAADGQEAAAFLREHPQTRYIDALFVDICGQMRGKRFPRSEFLPLYQRGMQIPLSVYLLDVMGDTHDPLGQGYSDGDPDGTGLPLPGLLQPVPWADVPRAQVLTTLYEAPGKHCTVEPRAILASVLNRFDELGLKPVVALELEFFLIEAARDEAGGPVPLRGPRDRRPASPQDVYSIQELDRYADFLEAVAAAAEVQKLPAGAATSELAPGQFEINLHHRNDALRACDEAALLRHLITGVARAQNCQATFMPKPFLDANGSGLHIHVSLENASGQNIFADGEPTGSDQLRHAIGGAQALLHEALAFFAADVNAFRRLVPNRFVPVNRAWGVNNRSTALRIPIGPPASRRLEHRVSAANANPYLATAAVLAGIHHGLVNRIDPGPPGEGNVGNVADPSLPNTFERALDVCERGVLLKPYLGAHYVETYCALKRAELAKFRSIMTTPEYIWYL